VPWSAPSPRDVPVVSLLTFLPLQTPRQYDCLQRLRNTPEVQKMIVNSLGVAPLPAHLAGVEIRVRASTP
jgi:hypothetical protein